jgi:uncharacterized membrane protein YphA (DoxX/SURF4 family)
MASSTPPAGRGGTINVLLWVAQVLVSATFILSGYLKFTTPIPELAKMMPWTGQMPVAFVRFMWWPLALHGRGIPSPV